MLDCGRLAVLQKTGVDMIAEVVDRLAGDPSRVVGAEFGFRDQL